jgi:outer membrane protein, multidrug efflux system
MRHLYSLIGQVANTYLMERELNELVCIAIKTIETRQEAYRIIRRRYEEGSSSKLDAVQADTILQQAKVDLAILQRKRELNWNGMVLLVGAPVNPDCILLSEIEACFTKEISPGLPSALLCNRPDILAAEHQLKAANANIGAARAAFFPTISLTGAFGTASSELKNLFHAGSRFWAYAPNISVPLFDWGRNASGLKLSVAQKKLAISEYEQAIQMAFREVADALTERTWYAEQIDLQKMALAAQEERTRLTWLRYEDGFSPYLEVLDAERDRFSAEQSLVQSRRSFLSSNVNLYIALGGGYCR